MTAFVCVIIVIQVIVCIVRDPSLCHFGCANADAESLKFKIYMQKMDALQLCVGAVLKQEGKITEHVHSPNVCSQCVSEMLVHVFPVRKLCFSILPRVGELLGGGLEGRCGVVQGLPRHHLKADQQWIQTRLGLPVGVVLGRGCIEVPEGQFIVRSLKKMPIFLIGPASLRRNLWGRGYRAQND